MSFGVLFAATLPGLVVLLVVLAAVERVSKRRRGLSAAGLDVFSAAMLPGRAIEQEHRAEAKERRINPSDGAPPHGIDVLRGRRTCAATRDGRSMISA
ncbi:hypothetical protein [Aeromicrobium sp. UC242_57]|uniref:hypothetical protein n=1 Tax=Aeromicrobium sp. UC242_57 TaxID=3374624 RepID=UPI00378F41F7